MRCLWCGNYSRQCKTIPSGPPEFIPPFILVTGMKCSYGQFPACLVRSQEPSQPALSYEHIKNFTKDLEARRDLGYQASPVNHAHMKWALKTCLHRQTSLDLIVLPKTRYTPLTCLDFIFRQVISTTHFKAHVVFFLQNKVELYVNRLDSVEAVIPYEYSRYWFTWMSLFVVYQSRINEDENPSCSKHPLPYASIPSAKLAQLIHLKYSKNPRVRTYIFLS